MQKHQLAIASLSLVILLTSTNLVEGVWSRGSCPKDVKALQEFNATKYLGTWYEYSKYPFALENGRCVKAVYGARDDPKEVSVVNSELNKSGKERKVEGYGKLLEGGKLQVHFHGMPTIGKSNYWVLATDYTKFAVVYSCFSARVTHTEYLWVLTRERNPSPEVVKQAEDAITAQKLSLEPLKKTDQSDCKN